MSIQVESFEEVDYRGVRFKDFAEMGTVNNVPISLKGNNVVPLPTTMLGRSAHPTPSVMSQLMSVELRLFAGIAWQLRPMMAWQLLLDVEWPLRRGMLWALLHEFD